MGKAKSERSTGSKRKLQVHSVGLPDQIQTDAIARPVKGKRSRAGDTTASERAASVSGKQSQLILKEARAQQREVDILLHDTQ